MRLPRLRPISLTPFLQEFRDYRFSTFRTEILAALAVALLTIPQAIAYSLLALQLKRRGRHGVALIDIILKLIHILITLDAMPIAVVFAAGVVITPLIILVHRACWEGTV